MIHHLGWLLWIVIKIYKGSYVESAAFNPSLGPLQAAVVVFIAGGGGEYDDIVGAVLVEKDESAKREEGTDVFLKRGSWIYNGERRLNMREREKGVSDPFGRER